jgi:DNA-binding transcriptional LysR family regulator
MARPNVSLRHLRAFVAVARQGSFTRAAESLLLSQSALTITIRQFEDEIGTQLFNRTTRQVGLTSDGEAFLPVAERLLDDFYSAITDMRATAKRKRGRVDIAAVPSVATQLTPNLVAAFTEAYPGTEVHVHDDNARGVHRRVRDNDADFGITSIWRPDPDLAFTPLTRDRFGVVCRGDHRLARKRGAVSWRDLDGEPFFRMAADTGVHPILAALDGVPESVRAPVGELLAMVTLAETVRAGLGITALPSLADPSRIDPELVFRKLVSPTVEREICIVTRRNRPLSAAARNLRDHLLAQVPRRMNTN